MTRVHQVGESPKQGYTTKSVLISAGVKQIGNHYKW